MRGRDLRRHDSARMLVELVATPVRVLAMQEVDLVIVLAPEERLQCCQRRIFGRAHIAGREHAVDDGQVVAGGGLHVAVRHAQAVGRRLV